MDNNIEEIKEQIQKVEMLTVHSLTQIRKGIKNLDADADLKHSFIVSMGYIETLQNALIDLKCNVRRQTK